MFKILVTTWINVAGRGVAVHSQVAEFPSRETAEHACVLIEEADDNLDFNQTAICLFELN